MQDLREALGRATPPSLKTGEKMNTEEFLNFGFDSYYINLTTYFGDVFLPWRTVILAVVIFAGLRVRKIIKTRKAGK